MHDAEETVHGYGDWRLDKHMTYVTDHMFRHSPRNDISTQGMQHELGRNVGVYVVGRVAGINGDAIAEPG